jgi:hypothetical protein
MAPAIGDYQPAPRRRVLRGVRGWAPVRMDSPLEGTGFEPSVPLPRLSSIPSGSRRDHRAKYGRLSARPRVRCLSPPALSPLRTSFSGGNVERSAETTRDDPDGEYLKRNRWFESGSLKR